MALFPTKTKPTGAVAVAAPASPPSAVGAAMLDHAPYAAIVAKADQINAKLRDGEAKAATLSMGLSRQPAQAADPIRSAALALLGSTDASAADRAAKEAQLDALRQEIAVLRVASEECEKLLHGHDKAAARAVLASATPEYRRRLVVHAEAVVEAARSLAGVQDFIRIVADEVGSVSNGLVNHAFLGLGDLADPYSATGLFIRELVENGILSGSELWLNGVAFYAHRPDGSAVNHAPPPVVAPPRRPAKLPVPPTPAPRNFFSNLGRGRPAPAPAPALTPVQNRGDTSDDDTASDDDAAADLAQHRASKATLKGGAVGVSGGASAGAGGGVSAPDARAAGG